MNALKSLLVRFVIRIGTENELHLYLKIMHSYSWGIRLSKAQIEAIFHLSR